MTRYEVSILIGPCSEEEAEVFAERMATEAENHGDGLGAVTSMGPCELEKWCWEE